MNLKELNDNELINLIINAKEELNRRKRKSKIIYNTDFTKGNSGYKRWAKEITNIDTTKTNGFAFVGNWLNSNNDIENLVTKGSYILEFIDKKIDQYKLYKALESNEKELILTSNKEEIISFILKCNKIINDEEVGIIDGLKD